jgi:hypothetical protein
VRPRAPEVGRVCARGLRGVARQPALCTLLRRVSTSARVAWKRVCNGDPSPHGLSAPTSRRATATRCGSGSLHSATHLRPAPARNI